MDRFVDDHNPPRIQPGLPGRSDVTSYVLITLFLGLAAVTLPGYWLGISGFPNTRWLGAALLLLAAASTLSSLARWLPGQNVVLAAVLIGLLGAAVEVVGISTGIGPVLGDSSRAMGQVFSTNRTLLIPVVWIVSVLNCRGVARLLLRTEQGRPAYGFWLLGCTLLLVVLMILSFAKFGPVVLPYFSPAARNMRLDWQTITTFLVCILGTLIMLLVVTPSLINKRPSRQPVDWHPLVLWTSFNVLFGTRAVAEHAWVAIVLILAESLAVVLLAVGGAGGPFRRILQIPA
jgi:hypothetical protein